MQETTNYKLKKPEQVDFIDVQDFNDNSNIIDNTLKELDTNKAALTYVDGKVSTINAELDLKADKAHVETKENKATYIAYTLSSSAWNSGYYNLESIYPQISYDIEVQPSSECTEAELEAWMDAKLVGSISYNYLYVKGDVPTINIPVYIKLISKS